jgi:hypothetical protein
MGCTMYIRLGQTLVLVKLVAQSHMAFVGSIENSSITFMLAIEISLMASLLHH